MIDRKSSPPATARLRRRLMSKAAATAHSAKTVLAILTLHLASALTSPMARQAIVEPRSRPDAGADPDPSQRWQSLLG